MNTPTATPAAILIGKRRFPFTSYAEASAAYCHAREAGGFTVSGRTGPAAPACTIVDANGATVARISYNGKVWKGADYVPGSAPLYDPYA